jgi:hypothetical protein
MISAVEIMNASLSDGPGGLDESSGVAPHSLTAATMIHDPRCADGRRAVVGTYYRRTHSRRTHDRLTCDRRAGHDWRTVGHRNRPAVDRMSLGCPERQADQRERGESEQAIHRSSPKVGEEQSAPRRADADLLGGASGSSAARLSHLPIAECLEKLDLRLPPSHHHHRKPRRAAQRTAKKLDPAADSIVTRLRVDRHSDTRGGLVHQIWEAIVQIRQTKSDPWPDSSY